MFSTTGVTVGWTIHDDARVTTCTFAFGRTTDDGRRAHTGRDQIAPSGACSRARASARDDSIISSSSGCGESFFRVEHPFDSIHSIRFGLEE